jgi:tRNA 2-thiocytidine biosynthesis protein TtcA
MLTTMGDYELVQAGDRIMVAVSGGKDSYTLLDLLERCRQRSPVPFELVAVHLDQKQPGYDGAPLAQWLAESGIPYEIVERDTYSVVTRVTKPGGTFCSACSRLRRGILYDTAERLGCNKIALGHHRDDALETLLMNLFFSGRLQAMPASYTTNDGRFQVLRPLIECAEADIRAHSAEAGYPILPCNLCGSQDGLKRDAMSALLTRLEGEIPDVRDVMLGALKHVAPTHLLDRKLAALATPGEAPLDPLLDGDCDSEPTAAKLEPLVIIEG